MANELYIKIIAEDGASAKFRAVGEEADDMSSEIESAGTAAKLAGEQIEQAGDDASGSGNDFNGASTKINKAADSYEKAGAQADKAADKVEKVGSKAASSGSIMDSSAVKMTTALAGVATSAFVLYSAFDALEDRQLQLEKAQLSADKTVKTVTDSQNTYNATLVKYGEDSDEARSAAESLTLAQEDYRLKVADVDKAQGDLNKSQMQLAIMAGPAAITTIKGICDAYSTLKNMDMVGSLNSITTALGNQKAMLFGVAAAAGAAFFIYTAFTSESESMKATCSLLAGALIGVAIAQWALNSALIAGLEISTLGLATGIVAIALASAGIVYAASSMYGAAEGAVVKGGSGGTPVLVGEGSRDELIMPLPRGFNASNLGAIGGGNTTTNYITLSVTSTKADAREIGQELYTLLQRKGGIRG